MRRPYELHNACHIAHVTDWPKYAKVWMAWGSGGWRPGIVVGHRDNRVAVRCIDGRWPFNGRRLNDLAFRSPNMLRARRGDERPNERSTGITPCVDMVAAQ